MPEPSDFADFISRIRAGDPVAAEELVRRYERDVRVVVRAKLAHTSLASYLDSVDIVQSVLASFFVRTALGQYDLADPRKLVGLLVTMARKKLASQFSAHILHQELLPPAAGGEIVLEGMAKGDDPASVVARADMLQAIRARLSPVERDIAERRGHGQSWDEIATALGGTAQSRRKELARAIGRIAPELGGDDDYE